VINTERAEAAIRELLIAVGEDPDREGLRATPHRSAKAWREMLSGYGADPHDIAKTSDGSAGFSEVGGYDQMIVVTGSTFWSLCEHHLLPFHGVADVAYLPNKDTGRVVGLSKIPRLVDAYARRLQVQERMTAQIADAVQMVTQAQGVGVRVRASHLCVACRGVQRPSRMTTTVLRGVFFDAEVRNEFLQSIGE
jgi:GTP cyclohydrolase IA